MTRCAFVGTNPTGELITSEFPVIRPRSGASSDKLTFGVSGSRQVALGLISERARSIDSDESFARDPSEILYLPHVLRAAGFTYG